MKEKIRPHVSFTRNSELDIRKRVFSRGFSVDVKVWELVAFQLLAHTACTSVSHIWRRLSIISSNDFFSPVQCPLSSWLHFSIFLLHINLSPTKQLPYFHQKKTFSLRFFPMVSPDPGCTLVLIQLNFTSEGNQTTGDDTSFGRRASWWAGVGA